MPVRVDADSCVGGATQLCKFGCTPVYVRLHNCPSQTGLRCASDEQLAQSLADDGGLVAGAVDDGASLVAPDASVDDEVDLASELFVDEFGVGDIFDVLLLVVGQGHGQQRRVELADDFARDGVVRHADAHFAAVAEDFRQAASCGEDEGERPGQVALHELERRGIHLGILADVRQVVADDGQAVLPRVNALQAADALDGPFLQGVAADGVARVRRVDDESSVAEQVGDAEEVGRIVVLFVKS